MDDNSMTLAVVILPPKSVTRYKLASSLNNADLGSILASKI